MVQLANKSTYIRIFLNLYSLILYSTISSRYSRVAFFGPAKVFILRLTKNEAQIQLLIWPKLIKLLLQKWCITVIGMCI